MDEPADTEVVIERGRIGPASEGRVQLPLPQVTCVANGKLRLQGESWAAERARRGDAWTSADELSEAALASIVQFALADSVAARGGVVLHSVGVALQRGAAVFTGPSGAGKSTLAQNAEAGGASLLSDELVVLLPESEGYRAHGTPWNRGFPRAAPLRCLGLLGWDAPHRMEGVSPAEVLRILLPNAYVLDTGAEARTALFERAGALLRAVPLRRWVFAPHPSVAVALNESLP